MNVENAFIFKRHKNMQHYYDSLPGLVGLVTQKAKEIAHQNIVNLATEQYDRVAVGASTGYYHAAKNAMDGAVDQIDDVLTEASENGVWTPFAQGFSVQVGCVNKRVIGLVQTQSRELYDNFMAKAEVREYVFSEIMGRPREISSIKWNERREDWKALELGKRHLHVLDYIIIEDFGIVVPSGNEVVTLPSLDIRLHKLAEEITISEVKKEFGLKSYDQLILFLTRNPEYSTRLAKNYQKFGGMLDKSLSIEKLQGI